MYVKWSYCSSPSYWALRFVLWLQIEQLQEKIPVHCGSFQGMLHRNKFFCPGLRSECIELSDGRWVTPKVFSIIGGKASLKNWKNAVRINNVSLMYRISTLWCLNNTWLYNFIWSVMLILKVKRCLPVFTSVDNTWTSAGWISTSMIRTAVANARTNLEAHSANTRVVSTAWKLNRCVLYIFCSFCHLCTTGFCQSRKLFLPCN